MIYPEMKPSPEFLIMKRPWIAPPLTFTDKIPIDVVLPQLSCYLKCFRAIS